VADDDRHLERLLPQHETPIRESAISAYQKLREDSQRLRLQLLTLIPDQAALNQIVELGESSRKLVRQVSLLVPPLPWRSGVIDRLRNTFDSTISAMKEFGQRLDAELGAPGARLHLWALIEDGASDQIRQEAMEGLAAVLVERWWVPEGSEEQECLRRRARDSSGRRRAKLDCLRVGLLTAAADVGRRQTIRVGRRWITDEDRRKAKVRPLDLDVYTFTYWFRKQALAASSAHLKGSPFPTEPGRDALTAGELVPLDDSLLLCDGRGVPTEAWIDACREVDRAYSCASPRQLEILDLLRDEHDGREIAARLGIAESTVRVQLARLRRRVKPM
jgi:hypothetical protein